MAAENSGVDYVSAPRDYHELFKTYYSYVVHLVHKMGIDNNSKEDVASAIFVRLYERDILSMFDPGKIIKHGGVEYRARFQSFLNAFVLAYVRGHRDRLARRSVREPLLCDAPATADDDTSWLEAYGSKSAVEPDTRHVEALMDYDDLLGHLRAFLANQPRRSGFDTCDLSALFDLCVCQIESEGKINRKDLAAQFQVSAPAISGWMRWLRLNLLQGLEERPGDSPAAALVGRRGPVQRVG